jgi:hypothetical protein
MVAWIGGCDGPSDYCLAGLVRLARVILAQGYGLDCLWSRFSVKLRRGVTCSTWAKIQAVAQAAGAQFRPW